MNKHKFMKKLLIFVLLCFVPLVLFAGCGRGDEQPNSNTYKAQLVISQSTITQSFSFPANVEYFKNSGESDESLQKYISELETAINIYFYNLWERNFNLSKNPTKVESLEFGNGEAVKTQPHYQAKSDSIEFSFSFTNNAWSYYHYKSNEDEKGDDGEQNNFFTVTTNSSGTFIFSQKLDESSLGKLEHDVVSAIQTSNFGDKAALLDEAMFEYDYVTCHKRIKSNADEDFIDGNYHYHVWKSDLAGLDEKGNITLSVTNAVTGWWYLVALGGAIIVVIIALTIVFLKEGNKKSKKVK